MSEARPRPAAVHLDDARSSVRDRSIPASNREDSAPPAESSRLPGDAPHPPAEDQRSTPEDARSILSEAESLVYGDRGRDYGPPWVDHQRVADIVNAWTGSDLDATDIQRVLVAVKLARMAESPTKRDHYVDAAGYLDCLWRTIERTPDEP